MSGNTSACPTLAPALSIATHQCMRVEVNRKAVDRLPQVRPVPQDILAKIRLACLDLPEAYEETAWAGTRWMVSKKNFAHAVTIDGGWPPAYAKAAGTKGPACVLTFRAPLAALQAPRYKRHPFFRPPWFANIAGIFIDADTDWDDVTALVVESYCVLAPRKLAALVERA